MSSKHIQVLLIEDNPGDTRLIRETMAEVGGGRFDLECVARLSAGLERLAGGGIDVVLLDLGLPDSEGLDTFVRVYAQVPQIPIVVLTGIADEVVGVEAVKGGAQDYLVKGQVDGNQLVRAMRHAIERKRAEEALQRSKREWESTFNAMSDWVCLLDLEMRILRTNRIGEELLGIPPTEMLGQTCCKLVHGVEKPIPRCPMQKMLQTHQRETIEFQVPDEDRWLIVTADPVMDEDGTVVSAVHIVRDITERKRAEEKLRRRSEELAALNAIAMAVTSTLDLQEVLRTIQEHVVASLGEKYPPMFGLFDEGDQTFEIVVTSRQKKLLERLGKLLGLKLEKLTFPLSTMNEAIRQTLLAGKPYVTNDASDFLGPRVGRGLVRATHRVLGVKCIVDVPLWVKGKFVGGMVHLSQREKISGEEMEILSSIASQAAIAIENARLYEAAQQELAERKRAQEALKEHSERLEEMVDERTQELREAQEQLVRREKLAVLGQLAGGVAHELRNPLGAISNAVYYLKMVLPDADETVKEYLEMISEDVRNSDKIITDLLDFSRTRIPDREKAAISELVAEVLEKRPPPENVEVATQIAPDLPPVYVDSRQIGQVLGNLVTNAYQAMKEGGHLTISAQAEEGQVAISVADTGSGIPQENIAKLFEPLFTTRAKGLGLGLTVVRILVEANGGSIEVESEEGKGSMFTVRLPHV